MKIMFENIWRWIGSFAVGVGLAFIVCGKFDKGIIPLIAGLIGSLIYLAVDICNMKREKQKRGKRYEEH